MDTSKENIESNSITIRAIRPDFTQGVKQHWFDGNPYTTHMINTLSFQFPSGEENFVKSVNHYKNQITDKQLKKEIRGFIGQELLHGKTHQEFNDWVASRVPHAKEYCDRIAELANIRYNRALKRNPIINLAVTVGLEHITAIIAANFLRRPDILDKIDTKVRALLIWHAIEEIEHKSVAFDVFCAMKGSYFTRVISMLIATSVFIGQTAYFQTKLLIQDGELGNLKAAWNFLKETFGPRGFFTAIIIPYLKYFSPNFHPSQQDERKLVAQWSEKLGQLTPVKVNGRSDSSSLEKGA
ncbi:MAG: metal-dependent hydrolase [Oligoflexus sp.]